MMKTCSHQLLKVCSHLMRHYLHHLGTNRWLLQGMSWAQWQQNKSKNFRFALSRWSIGNKWVLKVRCKIDRSIDKISHILWESLYLERRFKLWGSFLTSYEIRFYMPSVSNSCSSEFILIPNECQDSISQTRTRWRDIC